MAFLLPLLQSVSDRMGLVTSTSELMGVESHFGNLWFRFPLVSYYLLKISFNFRVFSFILRLFSFNLRVFHEDWKKKVASCQWCRMDEAFFQKWTGCGRKLLKYYWLRGFFFEYGGFIWRTPGSWAGWQSSSAWWFPPWCYQCTHTDASSQ